MKLREECEPEDLYEFAKRTRFGLYKEYFVGPVIYREYVIFDVDVADACDRLKDEGETEILENLGVGEYNLVLRDKITLAGEYTFVINPATEELIALLDEED